MKKNVSSVKKKINASNSLVDHELYIPNEIPKSCPENTKAGKTKN